MDNYLLFQSNLPQNMRFKSKKMQYKENQLKKSKFKLLKKIDEIRS